MKTPSQSVVSSHWSGAALARRVAANDSLLTAISFLLLALFCLLAPPTTRAATWYVATNGFDTNPGSPALPFKTIQHGIDSAADGDIINVAAGTYFEHIVWTNKSLSLQGAGPGQSIIDGAQSGTCLELDDVLDPSSLVAGFAIRNGRAFRGGMHNFGSSPTVSNCVFTGNIGTAGGGGMHNTHAHPTVIHCTFRNNTANDGSGMFNFASSPTVLSCTFTANTNVPMTTAQTEGGAMHNESTSNLPQSNPLVINCTFQDNNATRGGAIYSVFGSPTLVHCTFTGNGRVAMYNSYGSRAIVMNCIFWGNWSNPGEAPVFSNSLPATVTYSDVQGGWPGTGNISADPLFVNAASGNCRLHPNSPCINAGSASAPNLPATDFEGTPRITGVAPDLGAYESTAGLWFVDGASGHDASSGTPMAPFQTVTRALNAAASGQSIYIKQGNYGSARPRIDKSVRLFNWGDAGLVRLGQP